MINGNGNGRVSKLLVFLASIAAISAVAFRQPSQHNLNDLPNRIPEAAPYVVAEAEAFRLRITAIGRPRTARASARRVIKRYSMNGTAP